MKMIVGESGQQGVAVRLSKAKASSCHGEMRHRSMAAKHALRLSRRSRREREISSTVGVDCHEGCRAEKLRKPAEISFCLSGKLMRCGAATSSHAQLPGQLAGRGHLSQPFGRAMPR